ncbi:MAG: hypothetical protein HOI09_10430 [Porticoccaceae bacterium]|jgi:hypothetical protein|nr:hypothetical protein [Porticoccaceae bacterium]
MKTAILEINDQNLLLRAEDGELFVQPGFANVTANGIETGEEARAVAWREPQASYNEYWRQLNQVTLPTTHVWARHHADIAFAQLKQILTSANSPERLIIAVPGSFSDDQLSLLSGLADAFPTKIEALVDTALAACVDQRESNVLVELQLHQAIVSLITRSDEKMIVSQQEVIPNIGVLHIYNSIARHISETLIKNYRYDPLHTSEGEQAIYDQMSGWLMRLRWEDNIAIKLPSPQGELTLQLQKSNIDKILRQRLSNLKAAIQKHIDVTLIFSHSAILIPTLFKEYADTEVLLLSSAIENCARLEQRLKGSELHRITSLENIDTPKTKGKISPKVTHLAHDGHAHSLSQPLSVEIVSGQLYITNDINNAAAFVAVLENQKLKILKQKADLKIKLPNHFKPGEFIHLADNKLQLIEVVDG